MTHPPQYADTLIHADWIAPVDDTVQVLSGHSLALREGRIAALIPTPSARREWRARETVELPGHLLIPGLVNAHTHAAMTLLRGDGRRPAAEGVATAPHLARRSPL
ncbi:MAG: hypothetical protein WCP34_15520, partial [Pseudomonadota bacterium]